MLKISGWSNLLLCGSFHAGGKEQRRNLQGMEREIPKHMGGEYQILQSVNFWQEFGHDAWKCKYLTAVQWSLKRAELVSFGQLHSWWSAIKLRNFYADGLLCHTVRNPYVKLSKMQFSDQCLCLAFPADNQLQICARAVQTGLCWSFQFFLDHRPRRPQIQRPNAQCVQSCHELSLKAVLNKSSALSWCCDNHAMVHSRELEIYVRCGMQLLF